MANNKQAEKRNRQTEKRRIANRVTLGSMRTALRAARAAIDEKKPDAAELVRKAMSRIDAAVSKGSLKRRTASRYISRLARKANNA